MSSGASSPAQKVATLGPRLHRLPPISDSVVARPRVTEDLVARIGRHAIVHVVAPAGSGKTTAVVQAMEDTDRSVTWLTLEEWHSSAARLVDDLIDALDHISPGLRGEMARARAELGTVELAAIAGSFLRRHRALLVIDDCHLVMESEEALSVLAALVRRGAPGLHVVLVGRAPLPLRGVGVEALVPEATLGDDVLRASTAEAEQILAVRGEGIDIDAAVRVTGGWIAGLLFESWGSRDGSMATVDPLGGYLKREVRPRLAPDDDDLLVAASLFDMVDASRSAALGARDPQGWLGSIREAGVPGVWASGGSELHLHPRVREILRSELDRGPHERRRSALCAAAAVLEREGDLERALDLCLEIGDTNGVRRLVPEAIPDVIERQDVEAADRLLAAYDVDAEPAGIVFARLALASLRPDLPEGLAIVERWSAEGRFAELVIEEPAIGALACLFLVGAGRIDAAVGLVDAMPRGRPAEVGRIMLSLMRADPDAPIPPFQGDVLDAVLARALYHRGRLRELREGQTAWAESTGVFELDGSAEIPSRQSSRAAFLRVLARFTRAISLRDGETAKRCVADLDLAPWYRLLADVELAIRLERDPARALSNVARLREDELARAGFYTEVLSMWEGAARLLTDDAEGAAEVLREATGSMRRSDRTLMLSSALVYLAEAEWRLGEEQASDRATEGAYEVARRQGSLRELLLAFADFPGVLSRRLDAEPEPNSRWHSLGRALVGGTRREPAAIVASTAAHLREFGDPILVVDGRAVRPKIRKSLELLSYLLLAPTPRVSREAVLTALWNGRDDDSTRAYLRQALRHLRDALPDGITVTTIGDALSVEGAVTSESLELEALLVEAARDPGSGRLGYLLDALELANRGIFLEGSGDVQWVDDRRTRIESVVADARLDAAELLLAHERYLRALALVDEALDADPLLERAWRLRMQALDLLGDTDGVTHAYAACVGALAEIGLEPSAQTTKLARALRR